MNDNVAKAKAYVTLTLVDEYHRLWPEERRDLERAEAILERLSR